LPEEDSITELLRRWSAGSPDALEALIPLVHRELHDLAGQYLRREAFESTAPTSLVHDLYLRLLQTKRIEWEDRHHFFGIAARILRQLLVARARTRLSQKRGGGLAITELAPGVDAASPAALDTADVLALDTALTKLDGLDTQKARIVELRYFAGLSIEETAEAVGVSIATVKREWAFSKLWLRRELAGADGGAA
jgi:RNA polymerase sigma factor (TIGR02999 family)